MTAQEMNIAIAEWMGWTVINDVLCDPRPETKNGIQTGNVDINPVADLPNYAGDLNAINEAALTLGPDRGSVYCMELRRVISRDCRTPAHYVPGAEISCLISDLYFYHATAAQRCEALLKIIGRYKETEAAR